MVRQAIYLAIDKDSWINNVLRRPEAHPGLSPAVFIGPTIPTSKIRLQPDQAKQMLDSAGWTVASDGIRAKNGVRLSFSMSTTAGAKAREQAQALVQQNLKAVGIDMQIKNFPASVVWGEYTVKSQFDTLMVGWDPPFGTDPDYASRSPATRFQWTPGSVRIMCSIRTLR